MRPNRVLLALGAAAVASGVTLGAAAATAPTQAEPPLTATPRAECGPGSRPETDLQGRVPPADVASGRAAEGYTCNTELVSSFVTDSNGTFGGFKVERYVDAAGHECAYYDSTLLFPTNVAAPLADGGLGVIVLDMGDPTNPVMTDMLVTPAMLSPHESLVLSQERGVLAAVNGNPTIGPGVIDVYDVTADCRHPVLQAVTPVGIFGHESGLSPDGRTFYAASPASSTIVAVSLDDPTVPTPITVLDYPSHGLSVSDDGNRIYIAGIGTGMIIVDVSEIQARVPNPQTREISRLQWTSMSIPQNAIPVTIGGHAYVVEIDEFGLGAGAGAGRIIDIGDEASPVVVSNLRLEVHQPEHEAAIADDPMANNRFTGYAGHYCSVPRRQDPGIVACSMIKSGLRVFDIRDPLAPREVAYFNSPPVQGSNFAMSAPAFVPERNEVWYTDGYSGFHALRLTNGVWGASAAQPTTTTATTAAPSTTATTATRPAPAAGSLARTGWALPLGPATGAALVALALRRLAAAR